MSDPHEPPPSPVPSVPPRVGGNPLRWVVLYTRGLILNEHLRRVTMFYVVIAAMVMMFAGGIYVFDWREHPRRFVVYWLVVAWLTILSALLAIYDLILLRVRRRALQRELEQRFLDRAAEARTEDELP